MLCCVLLAVIQSQLDFNPTELRVQELLKPVGGSMAWVTPDPGESKDEWVLSVDVENKGRAFDFSVISSLQRLYALRVLGGKVDEKNLKALAKLPKLGLLVVTGSGLSDAGLKTIGACRAINKLDVAGAKISIGGLRALPQIKALRRLFLYNTEIKDKDIVPLESMTFLDQIVLPTTVSAEAATALGLKLRSTQIQRM